MRKGILYTILIMFIFMGASGQEVLHSLKCNTQLQYNRTQYGSTKNKTMYRGNILFFDDFYYCYKSKFPDTTNWMPNNQVFVNGTFPINPPSLGVATFDGLNDYGIPYDTVTLNISAQSADTLISRPIDLSPYATGDSIYLSFFYQPEGNGDTPNNGDSLVLEFSRHQNFVDSTFARDTITIVDTLLSSTGQDSIVTRDSSFYDFTKKIGYSVDSTLWFHQWAVNGMAEQPFVQVMIPIVDLNYFKNNFQFRFRNYASTTGDNDHWNLDYVKLGTGRTLGDTVLDDVSIQKYSTGILARYSEMPWKQFQANANGELASKFYEYIRNNFNSSQSVNYNYTAEEITNSISLSSSPNISSNFQAFSNDSAIYNSYVITPLLSLTEPVIKTTYTTNSSNEGTPQFHNNDTVIQYQHFRDFYAYDDGSAEKSYGILGLGARGALRFHLNTPDTLQAIQIHFEHVMGSQRNDLLSIMVWKSLAQNSVLYEKDFQHPTYIDSLNGFATYLIDTPFLVKDTIYVGWLQSQSDALDIGFDVNTDSHSNLFYNLSNNPSEWTNSAFNGSLMVRPFLGKRADLHLDATTVEKNDIKIYPNPVENQLRISNLTKDADYAIYSVLGTEVMRGKTYNGSINVDNLNEGIYFIKLLLNQNQEQFVYKFIKD